MTTKTRPDVYQIITDRIISELEKGSVPWHKPWSGGRSGIPDQNLVSGKPYQGINVISVWMAGFSSPYWLSFKQVKAKGGNVIKGSKGTPVVYYKMLDKKDKITGEIIGTIPMIRYSTVFNLDQTTDVKGVPEIKEPEEKTVNEQLASCEKIINEMPDTMPKVTHNEQRAYYQPVSDEINLPKMDTFDGAAEYYSTYFHEAVHATGHKSRLDRDTITEMNGYKSKSYSKEELIAEIGASFLNGEAGILNHVIENSTAYIASWLKRLKDDKKLIVSASGKAQKAVNYLLNI